jgi:hypothetical protein
MPVRPLPAYGTAGVIRVGVHVNVVAMIRYTPAPGAIAKSVPVHAVPVQYQRTVDCVAGFHRSTSVIRVDPRAFAMSLALP